MTTYEPVGAVYPPPRAQAQSRREHPEGTTVLLTGELGAVGGWLAVALLERGYAVRATLRNLANEAFVRARIVSLAATDDRLSFVAADLQANEGWDRATAKCDVLLHVASRSGRRAVESVLRAADQAGIERVSLTSITLTAPLEASRARASGEASEAADGACWTDIAAPELGHQARAMSLFRWMAPSFPPVPPPARTPARAESRPWSGFHGVEAGPSRRGAASNRQPPFSNARSVGA